MIINDFFSIPELVLSVVFFCVLLNDDYCDDFWSFVQLILFYLSGSNYPFNTF